VRDLIHDTVSDIFAAALFGLLSPSRECLLHVIQQGGDDVDHRGYADEKGPGLRPERGSTGVIMNGFGTQDPEGRLGDGEGTALRAYLAAVMAALSASPPTGAAGIAVAEISERVFAVLTGRDFCYLSKIQVAPYRESVLALIRGMVRAAEPIRFYYDLGAGYHATTHPGEEELCFDVGLAELLALRQVRSFSARVRTFYPPGVTFFLVIDNMAALLINDIDTASGDRNRLPDRQSGRADATAARERGAVSGSALRRGRGDRAGRAVSGGDRDFRAPAGSSDSGRAHDAASD
jgi:hypothetical protein